MENSIHDKPVEINSYINKAEGYVHLETAPLYSAVFCASKVHDKLTPYQALPSQLHRRHYNPVYQS